MKADEFIAFARKLLTLPAAQCPAGYRSVTSRLYYGIYHELVDFIEVELGFVHRKSYDNENKHLFILEYLLNTDEEEAKDLASQIRQLHERRKEADYALGKKLPDTDKYAIESVVRADRILNSLDQCRQNPLRGKIQADMLAYRRRRS